MLTLHPGMRQRLERAVLLARKLPAAARRELSRHSIQAFGAMYFPHIFSLGWKPYHVEHLGAVADGRASWLLVVWPRGHGKSRIWSILVPLHQVLVRGLTQAVIISRTEPVAGELLGVIRHELLTNELLRSDWGLADLARESQSFLELGDRRQFISKGIGYQIRGYHPPLIIVDDPENEQSASSETERQVLRNWLRRALIPALPPDGRLILVGNICHSQCLIAETLKEAQAPSSRWVATVKAALDENDQPLWPEAWSRKALRDRERTAGHHAFTLEYMNRPEPEAGRLFDVIPTYRKEDLPPLKDLNVFIVVDPAIGGNEWNSATAILVAGMDKDEVVWILDAQKGHYRAAETAARTLATFNRWNTPDHPVLTVGFESHGAAAEVFLTLQTVMREQRQMMPLKPLKPENRSKYARLQALQPLVEQGRFRVREDMVELVDELKDFEPTSTQSDLADACGYLPKVCYPPGVYSLRQIEDAADVPKNWVQVAHEELLRSVPQVDLRTGEVLAAAAGRQHPWFGRDW